MAYDQNPKLENDPLVTVFIGCYNHSRFVEECLDSVRYQTYPNLEVIIFDDRSKDNSVAVIDAWLKEKADNHDCKAFADQLARERAPRPINPLKDSKKGA